MLSSGGPCSTRHHQQPCEHTCRADKRCNVHVVQPVEQHHAHDRGEHTARQTGVGQAAVFLCCAVGPLLLCECAAAGTHHPADDVNSHQHKGAMPASASSCSLTFLPSCVVLKMRCSKLRC